MLNYQAASAQRLEQFMQHGGYLLAIETSCDETAVAILSGPTHVLAEVVVSQADLHARFGGVVPEVAARNHAQTLLPATQDCLDKAGISLQQIDAIAVTCGPGLVGALLTGVNFAKGLALSLGVPLLGTHHIEGHIAANFLANPQLTPPFICLVVSGGHSHLVRVEEASYHLLGCTQDDAAGEAFDKAARMLGLPYPGGPVLDNIAEQGDANALVLPRAKTQNPLDFSFSGLKTALMQRLAARQKAGTAVSTTDAAASFRKAVVDPLCDNAILACKMQHLSTLAVAGGVASNRLLRSQLAQRCEKQNIQLCIPPLCWCTDNAAMIGAAAWRRMMQGQVSDLSLNATPNLPLFL